MTEQELNALRQQVDKQIKYYSQTHTPEDTAKYAQYYYSWLQKHKDTVASGVHYFGDRSGWLYYGYVDPYGQSPLGYIMDLPPDIRAKAEKRRSDLQKQPYSPDYPDWLKSFYVEGKPLTYGGISDTYGPNNAFYSPSYNAIFLGSPNSVRAIWHELGHAQTHTQGLRPDDELNTDTIQNQKRIENGVGNYDIRYYPKPGERNFNDPAVLNKYLRMFGGHYPGDPLNRWDLLKRYYQARFREEVRASALGAKMAMEDGVPTDTAWRISHSGLPTYGTAYTYGLGLFNHDQLQAVERGVAAMFNERKAYANLGKNKNTKNSPTFYNPVAMPAYTREAQQEAIDEARREAKHPYVVNLLGKRPEGFEHTGYWVPGMEPLTWEDKLKEMSIYGSSPAMPQYRMEKFKDRWNVNNIQQDMKKPMIQRQQANRKYNIKNYATLEQFGHDVFDALSSSDHKDIDSLQSNYWPKEFYIDKNRWRELPYIYNAFRAFGRDGRPTENYKRRAAELLSYPEADYGGMMNRWHYNTAEWKDNFKKKFNIK